MFIDSHSHLGEAEFESDLESVLGRAREALVERVLRGRQRAALELTRFFHLTVEYWPIMDPTGLGETRETKLNAYRQTRDQIYDKLKTRWGEK